MKHFCACVFLLLSTVCLTGCSLNFQDFSSPDGSYSVKMPGKPGKTSTPGVDGEAWEVANGRWNFGVVKVNLPTRSGSLDAAQQATAVDLMVQGMASAFKATTKSTTPTNLNGFQGKEVEFSIPAGPNLSSGKPEPASTAVLRCYVVNSAMFVVMARSSNSITKDSPDVKTFFDSFKLSATASSSPAGMAGMPGGVPPAGTAMPVPGTNPAAMPPPNPSTAPGTPGIPVAGASSGFSPPPEVTPAPVNPLAGTAPPPGALPLPNGAVPVAGTNPPPIDLPIAANPAGVPAPGAVPPGLNPIGGIPGQTGNGNTPQFTGTPVTADTKLVVGDAVQVYYNNQWIDAKVTRVAPNGGVVQVRSLTKPPVWEFVPRNLMQKAGSSDAPQVAANDSPQTDPSGVPNSKASGFSNPSDSGLPNSKSTGFANSNDSGLPNSKAASKSRSSGSAKSAGESKTETVKSAGAVSLDGASVDELIKIIGKKGEHRKIQAAEKLRDHSEAEPNPEVAQKIVDLLKTDELIVRGAIAQALEKWACPEIHDAVVKNMTGGTTEVRQSMIKIMATLNADDSAERIAQTLTDKDDRKVAVEALVGLGEPAQGAVIKMLNHRDAKVKTAACEILQQIGSAEAIPALTKATSEWSSTERLAARKALKALEAKK